MDEVDTSPVHVARPILVVDDTPANLVAAEAALAPLGRPIITASSGTDALARLLEHDCSLVLLDVNMPEMDGFETARWIRSRERTQHVPIIFITANEHDHHAVLRAYALGAVDFLFKPLLPEVLRAKAAVFVTLQERTEQLAAVRLEREFENRRREELARLNAALAENDRRKDSFIAILAHELRNPLAPVRTCVDLIKQHPDRPLTSRQIEVLERQTATLARLVDDLLDLSRIKADKIELHPEHLDLADIVEAAVTTCRPAIDARRHAVTVEVTSRPVTVVGDAVRLAQIVCNLIANAVRYTPPDGKITLTCRADGEHAVVRISDNGIGIPADLQESIFQMFVQERVRSDGSGGLGLGLALARRLVEMHRGTIRVESAGRGQGSTFEIVIPLAMSARSLSPRLRTRDMEPIAKPLPPIRVRTLVVDDNEDARELVADLLRAAGHQVISAADGSSALTLLRDHQPDIALVDLGLPGMDGFDVIQSIRAQVPDLPTRFVALTGYGDPSHRERTRLAGFHGHLVKPASAAAILACIAEHASRVPGIG